MYEPDNIETRTNSFFANSQTRSDVSYCWMAVTFVACIVMLLILWGGFNLPFGVAFVAALVVIGAVAITILTISTRRKKVAELRQREADLQALRENK